MEDLDSFWIFQENFAVDELKQKLQYTTYELELTRKETNEEIRKSNEQIKKLCQLIQTTCKERDEAKAQLKNFQQIMFFSNKKTPNNVVNNYINPKTAPFSPDSPLLTTNYPTKLNSSITESTSFSLETHTKTNNTNNNVDNFSKPHVSSPDSSNVVNFSTPVVEKPATLDQESLIIANLAKGRSLPTKGKLLQAVIEAGPLLSTLMVAGSLPQWRNPPGVLTHQIPPVNLKGCVGSNPNGGASIGVPPVNLKECIGTDIGSNPNGGASIGVISHHIPPVNLKGCIGTDIGSNPSVDISIGVISHQLPPINPKGCISTNIGSNSNITIPIAGVLSHNNNKQIVMPTSSTMYNGHVSSSSGPIGISQNSMLDFGNGSCFMGGRMMMNSGVSFDYQIPKRQRII